jgi:Flp pilus assembly protein TadD
MGKFVPKLHIIIATALFFSFVSFSFSETKKDKNQAQIYRDKGYEAQRAGNLDMALSFYQRAVDLDPSYAVAYNDIGIILESKGLSDAAKEAYSKALEVDPKYLSSYYNLAALYEKEGNFDKAAYYWRMRVQLGDWSDSWTWKAKERIDSLKESGKLKDDAELAMTGADLSFMPDAKRDAKYHLYRGRQHIVAGDYVSALKELNAAVALDPQNQEIEKLLEDAQRKVLLYN